VSKDWRGLGWFVPFAVVGLALAAAAAGCGGPTASPTDGSADRRAAGDGGSADVGPGDLQAESRDGQDARDAQQPRDGSAGSDAPGDVSGDAPGDVSGDAPDAAVDAVTADATTDSSEAADMQVDATDAPADLGTGDSVAEGSDAADDAPADAPVEAGRPYVERSCGNQDSCACASNESCSFTCPGGGCAVTCAPGSVCTVSCASPFGCSVNCGDDAQCIVGCNLGVCSHFFGPPRTLACDPAGTGCF